MHLLVELRGYYADFWNQQNFPGYLAVIPHAADSALRYAKLLYHSGIVDTLDWRIDPPITYRRYSLHYYRIVQLESYLGVQHDSTILPPETHTQGLYFDNDYFVPAPLQDWQHDYATDVLRLMETARNKTQSYSTIVAAVDEQPLAEKPFGPTDTVVRILHNGVWGSNQMMIIARADDGRWWLHDCAYDNYCTIYGEPPVQDASMQEIPQEVVPRLRALLLKGYEAAHSPRMKTVQAIDAGCYMVEWRMGAQYKIVALDYWPRTMVREIDLLEREIWGIR